MAKSLRKGLIKSLSLCRTLAEGTRFGEYWQDGVKELLENDISPSDAYDLIDSISDKYEEDNDKADFIELKYDKDTHNPVEMLFTFNNISRALCKDYWKGVLEKTYYYKLTLDNEKISSYYEELVERVERLNEYIDRVDMKCINVVIPHSFHLVGRIIKEVLISLYRNETRVRVRVVRISNEMNGEYIKETEKAREKVEEIRKGDDDDETREGKLEEVWNASNKKLKKIIKGIMKRRANDIEDEKVRKDVKKRVKKWLKKGWGGIHFFE